MSVPDDNDLPKSESAKSNLSLKERLHHIDMELDKNTAQGRVRLSDTEQRKRSSLLGQAFRMSTELVVGVFGGGVIGWLADRLFGTLPLFLIVFLLLGIAAGILNAVREASKMSKQ